MPDFHIPNDPEWQWAYDAILYTTGGEFPEADPMALRAMGDELYAFTNNLLNGTAATSNLGNGLSAYLDGPAADAFNQFRGGIANNVPIAGNISWELGNAAYEFALDSESTQYNIVIAAFTQVVEIAFAIASGFGAAAVPGLIKVGQEIVKTLIEFFRMRLQNQLLRLAWEGVEEGLEELWQGMAAQLTQMAEGNRKGFDYQDLALAFAGGFFIGMGVSGMHAIGGKLYPKINKNTYTRETLSALAETLFEGLFSMMVGGGFNPFATMTSSIIGGLAHQYAHDFGKQFGADPQNLPDRPSPDPKTGSDKAKTPPTSVEGPPPPAYHDIGDSPPSYDQAAGGPPPYSETPGDPPPYNEATGPSNAATGAPPSVGSSPVPGSPVTNGSHTAQPSDAERDGALTPGAAPAFANRPDLSTVDAPVPNGSVAPAPGTAPASAGALRPGIAGVNQLESSNGQVPAQTTGSAGSVAEHPAATPAAPPPATSPAEDVAPVAAPAGADATLPANAGGLPGFESTSPAASAPTNPTAPPPVIVETTAPTSTQAADPAASPVGDPAGQAPTVATPLTAVPAVEVPRTGGPDAESPVVQAPTSQSPALQPPTTQSPGQQISSGSIPNAQENNAPLSFASLPPQIANPVASAPATIEQGSTVPGPAVKPALASESGIAGQALDTQQTLVTSNPHPTYMTTTTTQPSLTSGTMQSPLSSDSPLRNDSTRDTTTRTEGAGDRDSRFQADGPRRTSGQHDPVVTVSPTVEVAPATSRGHTDIVDLPSGSSTDSGAEDGPRTTAASIGPTADGMKPSPVTPQSGPAIPAPRGAPDAVLRTEPAAVSTSNPEATAPISPFAPVPANESNQGQSTTESYDGLALGGTGNQAAPGSAPVLLADVVPRDQWWRLYLDPKHHDAAQDAYPSDPGSYYDNDQSPGFQKGMIEAYEQFLNNPDINSNNLDADTYKQIHEKVTRYLNKQFDWTGAPTPKGISSPTSFPVRSPGISPDVLTEDIGGRPLVQDFNLALRQTDGPKPVTFTSTIMDRRGISAIRRPRSITTNYSRNDAPTLVNTIFDQYRHERQNATTPDATLAAIARTIRKLHITHPFQDGNRRLNVHVILPKLLLDNGFQPVIAPDMDQLFQGGRSIDDIVTVLRDAQPATAGIRLGTGPNQKANVVPAAQITTVVDVPAITSVAAQTDTTALAASSEGHRHDSSSVVPLATVVRGADGTLRASGRPLVIRPLTGDRPGIALLDDGDWNRISTRTLLPPDTYAAGQDRDGSPATAVIVHGVDDVVHAPVRNPDGSTTMVALGPDALAQVIGRPGEPIVLVSCETGALAGGFAHQLAHARAGDVLAPKTVITVGATGVEGGLHTAGNESWQLYTPESLDDEGWDAVNDVATGIPPLFGINADPEPTTGPRSTTDTSPTNDPKKFEDGSISLGKQRDGKGPSKTELVEQVDRIVKDLTPESNRTWVGRAGSDVRLRFARNKSEERAAQTLSHLSFMLHDVFRRLRDDSGDKGQPRDLEVQSMLINGRLLIATNFNATIDLLRAIRLPKDSNPIPTLLKYPQSEDGRRSGNTRQEADEYVGRVERSRIKIQDLFNNRRDDAAAVAVVNRRGIKFIDAEEDRGESLIKALTSSWYSDRLIFVTHKGSAKSSLHAEQKLLLAVRNASLSPKNIKGSYIVMGKFRPCLGCWAALNHHADSGFPIAFNENYGTYYTESIKLLAKYLPHTFVDPRGKVSNYLADIVKSELESINTRPPARGLVSVSALSRQAHNDASDYYNNGWERIIAASDAPGRGYVTPSDSDVEYDKETEEITHKLRRLDLVAADHVHTRGEEKRGGITSRKAQAVLTDERRKELERAWKGGDPKFTELLQRYSKDGASNRELAGASGASEQHVGRLIKGKTGHERGHGLSGREVKRRRARPTLDDAGQSALAGAMGEDFYRSWFYADKVKAADIPDPLKQEIRIAGGVYSTTSIAEFLKVPLQSLKRNVEKWGGIVDSTPSKVGIDGDHDDTNTMYDDTNTMYYDKDLGQWMHIPPDPDVMDYEPTGASHAGPSSASGSRLPQVAYSSAGASQLPQVAYSTAPITYNVAPQAAPAADPAPPPANTVPIHDPDHGPAVYEDNSGRQFYLNPETNQWEYYDDNEWHDYRAFDPHGKRKYTR